MCQRIPTKLPNQLMRIKCPECSQKFDVTEEFLGKTVECGSCDHRFKVADDHVITEKQRFYPGEKRDRSLDNFGKSAAEVAAPVTFQQAQYNPGVTSDQVGPPRPRRTLAAVVGVSILVLVIVLFLAAGGKEGSMRDMETAKRFIFVGFTVLIGGGLLFYGTTHMRKVGLLATFILCALVLSLPIIFPANPVSSTVIENPKELEKLVDNSVDEELAMKDYLFEIGYDPVRKAIAGGAEDTVVAIYLRNASKAARTKIAAYLYSATDKVSRETSYDRGSTELNGLILLVEQEKNIDEVALLCEKFGRIEKISREYRVVDVIVDPMKMGVLDESKALDSENIDFQRQNIIGMQNIDPDVQIKAVKRLANSEPKALRTDVTKQMVKMLPTASKELKIELIRGLKVWSQPGDGAEKAAYTAVQELHREGAVEKSGIDFLLMRKVDGVGVILIDLWKKNPVVWAETLQGLGKGAELLLIPILSEFNDTQIVAASDILGEVGTSDSISYLKKAMGGEISATAKKSLQAAIDEIEKRS